MLNREGLFYFFVPPKIVIGLKPPPLDIFLIDFQGKEATLWLTKHTRIQRAMWRI